MEFSLTFALFVTFLSLTFGKEHYDTKFGKVLFYSKQANDLSGKLTDLQGKFSLNFNSKVRNNEALLIISDAAANNVIISYHFKENAIGYMQLGHFGFIENPEDDTALYVSEMDDIPAELNQEEDEKLYNRMQQESARNMTKTFAFEEVKGRVNIEKIETLVHALGEGVGLRGDEFPSALAIYAAAKSFLSPTNLRAYTAKDCDTMSGNGLCPNEKSKSCKNKPIGKDCLGMCGYGTKCWSYVCGDCCNHRGCCLRNVCCRKHGMTSWQCLWIFGFSCKNYRKC